MKKLFAKLGVEINVEDKEFEVLINAVKNGNGIIASKLINSWFAQGRFTLHGETYFPEKDYLNNSEEFNNPDYELNIEL